VTLPQIPGPPDPLTPPRQPPSNLLTVDGSEANALAEARAGNRDAFRTLVERHSRAVFRVAYRITGNEQDAEDVVQDAFLKAYLELSRFEGRAGFGTWVHRIAANCAIDLVRRRPRNAVDGDAEDGVPLLARLASPAPGPEREAAGRQARSRIDAALVSLTPLERAAFTLRHLEQRSVDEISATLGQNPAATRHSIFRAVAKMRRALGPTVRTDP
jgi:RNA polymerase sigma-70 factor (ECF subfamily)